MAGVDCHVECNDLRCMTCRDENHSEIITIFFRIPLAVVELKPTDCSHDLMERNDLLRENQQCQKIGFIFLKNILVEM